MHPRVFQLLSSLSSPLAIRQQSERIVVVQMSLLPEVFGFDDGAIFRSEIACLNFA